MIRSPQEYQFAMQELDVLSSKGEALLPKEQSRIQQLRRELDECDGSSVPST